MSRLSKELKLGFVFLLALISLVYGLKYLKGINVFKTNKSYYAVYADVDGLQIGSGVMLNGFNIGIVSNIKLLTSNNNLIVTLNLNEFDSLPDNSICKIINQDLMGTKGVALIIGSSSSYSKIGDTLESGIENSLQDEVNAQILPLKNKAEELIGSVDSLLVIVAAVLNKNTRANLSNSIKSLDKTFEILSRTMIKIDSVVYKNDSKISKIISNLESMTSNLNEGNSDIKAILYNLSSITDSLAKSNITSLLENINEISYNINSGEGSLAKFMNDDNLYNNLEKSTSELAALIEDVKNNPKRYVNFSILGGNKKSYDKNKLK